MFFYFISECNEMLWCFLMRGHPLSTPVDSRLEFQFGLWCERCSSQGQEVGLGLFLGLTLLNQMLKHTHTHTQHHHHTRSPTHTLALTKPTYTRSHQTLHANKSDFIYLVSLQTQLGMDNPHPNLNNHPHHNRMWASRTLLLVISSLESL